MKGKFICCYLEENYGMSVYESKEELLENFGEMYDVETFDELIEAMKGDYEVIEIESVSELKFIVEE